MEGKTGRIEGGAKRRSKLASGSYRRSGSVIVTSSEHRWLEASKNSCLMLGGSERGQPAKINKEFLLLGSQDELSHCNKEHASHCGGSIHIPANVKRVFLIFTEQSETFTEIGFAPWDALLSSSLQPSVRNVIKDKHNRDSQRFPWLDAQVKGLQQFSCVGMHSMVWV